MRARNAAALTIVVLASCPLSRASADAPRPAPAPSLAPTAPSATATSTATATSPATATATATVTATPPATATVTATSPANATATPRATATPLAPATATATSPSTAPAASADAAAIAAARRAVEDQRYEEALALLAPLLASPSRRTRAAALEITAVVRLLVGKTAEGREAVASLFEMAPAFQLDDPSLPPRVTRVFDAEAAVPHARTVTLAIRPAQDERGAFEISTSQPAGAIDLACSSAKPPRFSPITVVRKQSAFHFRLPTLTPHACYAVARDSDALPLGRLASAARPADVIVPPPAPPAPLYTRWWLWSSIGVVAAGVAVGAALAAADKPPSVPPADITLRPQGAVFSW